MPDPESTRWTLVRGAAEGEASAREEFARLYEPVVRAYLEARWRGSPLAPEVDDAAQDVFLDCFREAGPLTRADSRFSGGFRAFLRGVVRNIARRRERDRRTRRERQLGAKASLDDFGADEESLAHVFDRAWAQSLLRQAADLHAERAREAGGLAERRVELLRLRFTEGLPIRDIARRWDEDRTRVHYHYARAREEFQQALREVVRLHDPSAPVEEECLRLLEHLA
jgi:RNA polymerase sigma factor (sigma-70 family)